MELWTEKYRPKKLDEVVGQKNIVDKLKSFVKEKNLPHLLFAGPAGTGKTTCALAIAKEIYGEHWSRNFLELNASDERGINTIRTKVKDFARTKPIRSFSFKIILLDEADSLTKDAQQALRRMMEQYSKNCRFILDCNFPSKIIDPIKSRCAVLRFKPLDDESIISYVGRIMKSEKLGADKKTLGAIAKVSEGDARKAVNILQSCAYLGRIDEKTVYEVASMAHPEEIKHAINTAFKGNIRGAMDMLHDIMVKYGMDGVDVLKQIHTYIVEADIERKKKAEISSRIAEYEYRIVEGADEFLQLEALLAQLCFLWSK